MPSFWVATVEVKIFIDNMILLIETPKELFKTINSNINLVLTGYKNLCSYFNCIFLQ